MNYKTNYLLSERRKQFSLNIYIHIQLHNHIIQSCENNIFIQSFNIANPLLINNDKKRIQILFFLLFFSSQYVSII